MKKLLILGLLGIYACDKPEQKAPPPPQIPVVEVIQQDVPIEKEFVGQIYGYFDIPIRARVEGFLEGIHFTEGLPVTKGQLLYSIDQQPFLAAMASSKSKLAEAQIAAVNAQNELKRYQPLAEINAVSQSDLDAAIAADGAAKAAVEAAEAELRMARINLSYTKMRSPIKGLIGKSDAKVGEFVGKDPNPVILNTVSRIDSIHVQFFITEKDHLRFARLYPVDDRPPRERGANNLKLILADGSLFPHLGGVDFADREIDPSTGSMLIQATFPNPNRLLRPGGFAKVRAVILQVENGLLVPQRCVRQIQGINSVFVVTADNIIEERPISLGPTYKDLWLVIEGLEPGEKIVLEGLQKVRNGVSVVPQLQTFESKFVDKL